MWQSLVTLKEDVSERVSAMFSGGGGGGRRVSGSQRGRAARAQSHWERLKNLRYSGSTSQSMEWGQGEDGTYKTPECEGTSEEQQFKYFQTIRTNIRDWLPKSLGHDKIDWYTDKLPEKAPDGHYQTPLPVILFQMVEQNLQVAKQISSEMTLKVCHLCLEELIAFAREYKEEMLAFKTMHLGNRSEPPNYVQFMVALVNNCSSMIEFTNQLMSRYVQPIKGSPSLISAVTKLSKTLKHSFHEIACEGCNMLLEEAFTDLAIFLQDLVSRKWLTSTQACDTIAATMEDYCIDFRLLKTRYFQSLIQEAEIRVVIEYIKAIMQKKVTFKNYGERKDGAEKVVKECRELKTKFEMLAPGAPHRHQPDQPNPWEAMPLIGELIKLQDPTLLGFEISQLANKYSDVKVDHIICIILLRGDMTRGDARQLVIDTIGEEGGATSGAKAKASVFSRIQVT